MAEAAINTTVAFRLPVSLHTQLVRLAEEAGIKKHKPARKRNPSKSHGTLSNSASHPTENL
jgi:hypothetical protein